MVGAVSGSTKPASVLPCVSAAQTSQMKCESFPNEVRIAETMIASDTQIFASLRDGDRHHQSVPNNMIKDFLHTVLAGDVERLGTP